LQRRERHVGAGARDVFEMAAIGVRVREQREIAEIGGQIRHDARRLRRHDAEPKEVQRERFQHVTPP